MLDDDNIWPVLFYPTLKSLTTAQSKDKEDFECPNGVGNGDFADPTQCRRFYQVYE